MRKTKIICTIGPACESEEMLTKLCLAGMNVARLNFSHGTHEEHLQRINTIKKVREKLQLPIGILLDTKGPEFRTGTFKDGSITLNNGDTFTFTTDDIEGDNTQVSVSYKNLHNELNSGDRILVNNGLVIFEVKEINGTRIVTEVITGGVLSDRKSMSFPGKHLKQTYLSEQDKKDILFGAENDIDFIACSFVSSKQDLLDVQKLLDDNGYGDTATLIAKIENQAGYDNIHEINEACDGVMVARGDMGVEVDLERLPIIQKNLIEICRTTGKRTIVATEMLESMIRSPRPTRAETSDVANAVFDGASAVMLSGETAAGAYPEEAVRTMSRIVQATEESINYEKRFRNYAFQINNDVDAISHATCGMAMDLKAKVIVACTLSGSTARMVSRFRPPVDIIGLTTSEKTWRSLSLSWGVTPVMCDLFHSTDVLFYTAKLKAEETFNLQKNDNIIITGGVTNGKSGNTNLIKIETV